MLLLITKHYWGQHKGITHNISLQILWHKILFVRGGGYLTDDYVSLGQICPDMLNIVLVSAL